MGNKKADITAEQLLADGWTKTDDRMYPFEKKIENQNPLNAGEDSDLKLTVHGHYNQWSFAVVFPDGGLLNFVANSMDELTRFEKQIVFYDPPF